MIHLYDTHLLLAMLHHAPTEPPREVVNEHPDRRTPCVQRGHETTQSRSTIVTFASPPPSHIVCKP